MRVCFLNEFFYPDMDGGTPKVMSDLASQIRKGFGDEVTAVTTRNSYRDPSVRLSPEENWAGVRIVRVEAPHWTAKKTPQRLLGNLVFTRRAVRQLRSISADVTFVSTAPATLPIAANAYQRRTGAPYVYIVYDLDPDRAVVLGLVDRDSMPARILRSHQRRWLHGAAKVVVIGRCMKQHLMREYGVPSDRVEVIEVGADPDTVRPLPKHEARFREKNGLAGFVLAYTGNFGKYHDFDSVLDAAKLVAKEVPDVTFALVGRGAKKAQIEKRIKDEGIANVRMFDFVPDADYADLLSAADVCLVTLEAGMEGLCVPSKFYSILAAGRPTLATMNPEAEVAYTLAEADCGVSVGLGDPKAIADAVLALRADPEGLERMGRNARAVFDEKYASPIIAARMRATLAAAAESRLVGAGRKPRR